MGKNSKTDMLGEYKGVPFESNEEHAFLMWAFELMEAGYIENIERAATFTLSTGVTHRYEQVTALKTKTKVEEKRQVLLTPHVYTPEYKIIWTRKAYESPFLWVIGQEGKKEGLFVGEGIFSGDFEGAFTYIEVKPVFDHQNMTRAFKINQKWMWEAHRIFVNLVKPQELFAETFTPRAYLTTPKTGRPRAIKWDVLTISEFLNH